MGQVQQRKSKMQPAPKRTALYARVSTTNHGQDVGLQLDELRRVAHQRGWQVVEEYVDDGVSGSKESRPALDRLKKAVQSGTIDVVAVWRFDRFARSTQQLLAALEDFRQHGVEFVSLRESVDTTTPAGKMVFTFLAAVAEFEKALIVERVRAGVARAQESGTHCGRPRVELELRPALALIQQGHGLKAIAAMLQVPRSTLRRRLQEAGLDTRTGVMPGCPEVTA
jgi:DNA invertase Pin-like site-specific DNA recombinase